MAKKDDFIKMKGVVTEKKPAARFRVELENGHVLHGVLSGKIRRFNIRIDVGDTVDLEISPYDWSIGRIIYRYK